MRIVTAAFGFLVVLARIISATAMATSVVTLAPLGGHPTQVVTVTGTGFADSEAVDVYFDTTDTELIVSTATGTLSATLTVPAAAQPGIHYVTAIGRKSGDAAQSKFNVSTPWNEMGFGAAHLDFNPYENTISTSNVSQLGQLWSSSAMDGGGGTPTIMGTSVYIGTQGGVVALSTTTGALVWTAAKTDYFLGAVAAAGAYVYIGSETGYVYSLVSTTGAVHWSTKLPAAFYGSPTVVNNIVYIGCTNDIMYALNATTGAILWSYTTGGYLDTTPAVVGGVVYFGSNDDKFYALNATTGALIWSYTAGGAVEASAAVAAGVAYFGADDGKVYALKTNGPDAGALLWTYTTNGSVFAAPAVANGVVFAGSAGGIVYGLNAHTGTLNWSYTTGTAIVRGPIVANGVVYASVDDDSLYAFNIYGELLATAVTGPSYIGTPAISNGVLYIGVSGSDTYAFALQAGTNAIRAPKPAALRPDPRLVVSVR